MPSSSRPVPVGAADDVWHRHEAQIKDLYQNQRKTLREVKRLMEENGFPKTPLSTWESKLRERLQLRKKAKSHDWPLIYQHILPRLEHPRKKRFKRKTIISLNGSQIPWNKAWKEIRRSGVLGTDSHLTSASPLPPEVTIRTPSQGPLASPSTPRAAQPVVSDVSTTSNRTTSLAVVPLQTSVAAPYIQPRSLTYSFSVYLLQWCASTIPWLEMCQSIQHMFRGGKQTRQLEMLFSSVLDEFLVTSAIARAVQSQARNETTSSETRLDLLRDDQPIPPRPSPDLGYRIAKSGDQIQLTQFISTAIFLLSNKLHDQDDGDQGLELLCSILDRDASLTTTLLRSHVPSIRAAWESLFEFAMRKKRRDTFRILTDIGIHNHWLNPLESGRCLLCAVETDSYDTMANIVVYCCDSGCSRWWRNSFDAILAACRKGNIECASLLIQHCNVNEKRIRALPGVSDRSMFSNLVAKFRSSEHGHALALDLFLANGANVDKKTSHRQAIMIRWRQLVGRAEPFDATRPTILDEVFYLNRSLFDKLSPYSRVPVSRITRTGLLVALEHGSQNLREYLSARQSVIPSFHWRHLQPLLELLLAEQFTIPERVDLRIVQGLFEYGVDFKMPSVELDLRDFWRWHAASEIFERPWRAAKHLEFSWHQFANVNDRMKLLNMLLIQGGAIGECVLEGVVAQHGTGGLESLIPHLTDFPAKAVRALARSARLNNFEDVEFLLREGVDPNALLIADDRSYSIPAVATLAAPIEVRGTLCEVSDGGCSLEMIQLLARHGARLVVTPEDSSPFDFACHLLQESNLSDLFAKIKYVLGILMEGETSSHLPSFLLESCIARSYHTSEAPDKSREKRLEIFEYLFRQGAEVRPGSPLAALVYEGGREDLVRDVLYAGSDINACWDISNNTFTPLQAAAHQGNETLISLFLREGANVNSPAVGKQGNTALGGICSWAPSTEEEHQRKMRICHLLIDQGADVNPAPVGWGSTLLGEAAMMGDLELAALLLREGADVNACPGRYNKYWTRETALDAAALYGRLDMVQFLLKANALSSDRGAHGYDGAISLAEESGKLAVADLIRQHAAKVEAGTVFNLELLKAPNKSFGFGFITDDSSSDDDYETSADGCAEDVDAAGATSGLQKTEFSHREVAQTEQNEQVVPEGGAPIHSDPGFVLSEAEWPMVSEGESIQHTDLLDPTETWTGQVATINVAGGIENHSGAFSSLFGFDPLADPAL